MSASSCPGFSYDGNWKRQVAAGKLLPGGQWLQRGCRHNGAGRSHQQNQTTDADFSVQSVKTQQARR